MSPRSLRGRGRNARGRSGRAVSRLLVAPRKVGRSRSAREVGLDARKREAAASPRRALALPRYPWPMSDATTMTLPAVGEVAPDFTLPDDTGAMRTLSAERGHWLVLYFYPKDDTPGCTTESCQFRDAYELYQRERRRGLGHQRPGQRQQGSLQGQVRSALHAHRRRAARGRGALRRVGGQGELRQDVQGHRARHVPHRPAGRHREGLAEGVSRTDMPRRSWRPSTSSAAARHDGTLAGPSGQRVRHRSWGERAMPRRGR